MTRNKLYFAHAINAYNTPEEEAAVRLIEARFPNCVIENPNQPKHQVGYKEWQERTAKDRDSHKGMSYFFDVVLPKCVAGCVAMPFLDGLMSLGVAGEAAWFLKKNWPVWYMAPAPNATAAQLQEFIKNPFINLFHIRQFTVNEQAQLLMMDLPQLILSHQETRLRTWTVYNKVKRSYETAHEVSMSVPPGFYPEK